MMLKRKLEVKQKMNQTFTIESSRSDKVRIPVSITVPDLKENEKAPVVIFAHGFLGNKDEYGFYYGATIEERGFEGFAEQLMKIGIGSIRIDQPGTGDSEDDFRNYTLENCGSDLRDAYRYCMDNYPFDSDRTGVLAWSMGAKVSAELALETAEIDPIVLLNPAGDNGNNAIYHGIDAGIDYPNLEKEAMANGEVVNTVAPELIGSDKTFVMSKEFFIQVNASKTGDMIYEMSKTGKHVLMIYGDEDTVISKSTYEWLIENAGIDYVCIPSMAHDLGLDCERPELTNIVIDVAGAYLYRYLKA